MKQSDKIEPSGEPCHFGLKWGFFRIFREIIPS
nr:MAG TPA: hypothetical protein [Caudoviricetes sp.]